MDDRLQDPVVTDAYIPGSYFGPKRDTVFADGPSLICIPRREERRENGRSKDSIAEGGEERNGHGAFGARLGGAGPARPLMAL